MKHDGQGTAGCSTPPTCSLTIPPNENHPSGAKVVRAEFVNTAVAEANDDEFK
jgi:hypothetical protein